MDSPKELNEQEKIQLSNTAQTTYDEYNKISDMGKEKMPVQSLTEKVRLSLFRRLNNYLLPITGL
jgi:hypothetical protein